MQKICRIRLVRLEEIKTCFIGLVNTLWLFSQDLISGMIKLPYFRVFIVCGFAMKMLDFSSEIPKTA